MSPNTTISFEEPSDVSEDGWFSFNITHAGGSHVLQILYASPNSRPCRVRIGSQVQWVMVACGTCDSPQWFNHEGVFDLGKKGTVEVAFQSVKNAWPEIRAFRFVPEHSNSISSSSLGTARTDRYSSGWSPGTFNPFASVTFTFEIGLSSEYMATEQDVEYISLFLPGRAVKFMFGEAHDCFVIDGDPIGDQQAGDNFPHVTFVGDNDFISTITMGLSNWTDMDGVTGFAAFTGLTFERRGKKRVFAKNPLVGASLMEPTWTYDRRRLGLNLWMTSLCAPRNKTVSRYGFTLSSDDELEFDIGQFDRFWDWFTQTKAHMVQNSIESVREKLQPTYQFLVRSFSGKPSNPLTAEGYLYGTRRHISITYDIFSVHIYRLPNGEDFQSTLFVKGRQYNTDRKGIDEIALSRTHVLALAISYALADTDLLFQMGLIRPQGTREGKDVNEVELLKLRKGKKLFRGGTFENTEMARRVINILASAGLRQVAIDTILEDKSGWDIYDVGAGAARMFAHHRKFDVSFVSAALVCSLIQLLLPILLIWRGATSDKEELTWDVYLARLLFGLYAVFFENKTREVDSGDRITGLLCFLPEFDTNRLMFGIMVNKLSKLVINVAIIFLVLTGYTVADVTLNALALYFVFDVDDDLVADRAIEDIRQFQKREYFVIKSKTSLEYTSEHFPDAELPAIGDLPSAFFVLTSTPIPILAIGLLCAGCIWIFLEPWVRGWD